ncbi:MAG: hypothetical protein JST00_18100 [Deltaproteobacteria bacterium]|nr:hypothetical protein [Deltaproteobacteria bacterium]
MKEARPCTATAMLVLLGLSFPTLAGCSSSPSHPPPFVPRHAEATAEEYVVGGHVRGLEGIGLSLRSSNGDEVTVDDDGKFVFGGRIPNWTAYEIRVAREPISPPQTCTVERASGRINGKDVMNVDVVCKTVAFEPALEARAEL